MPKPPLVEVKLMEFARKRNRLMNVNRGVLRRHSAEAPDVRSERPVANTIDLAFLSKSQTWSLQAAT